MNLNFINSLIVSPLTAAIGVFPYYRRPNEVTRYFALANVALAIWNLGESSTLLFSSHSNKLLAYRLSYIAGVIVVLFFFRFCFAFSKIELKTIPLLWRGIVSVGIFLLACLPTRLFIADINEFDAQEVPGKVYPVFILYMLGALSYALFRMFQNYSETSGDGRVRYKYLFIALCMSFLEAVLFFLSSYVFNIPSYYYYLQIVYVVIIGYAIAAHQLMDVRVVVRKTLVYSVVTGSLTAIYLLIATQMTNVLEGMGGRAGFWSSAIAAVAVTLLFNPLLNKVRSFMNERFFGDWLHDMSRGVIHEVKRPLASISMPAQLTLMELEDVKSGKQSFKDFIPTLEERLKGIIWYAQEAGERIESLRLIADSQVASTEPVQWDNVLAVVLVSLEPLLKQANFQVELSIPTNLPAVRSSPRQLEMVARNLIKNAVEAVSDITQKPFVKVSAWEQNNEVYLSVKDNGNGIKSEDIPRIFDADFTTKGTKGMGVGLYLVHRVVRSFQGAINASSAVGRGSEFIVRLPKYSVERAA